MLKAKAANPLGLIYLVLSRMSGFETHSGAAIPNVSDTDLANIIIHLPEQKTIDDISNKMKKAFELRQASKQQIESIELEFA